MWSGEPGVKEGLGELGRETQGRRGHQQFMGERGQLSFLEFIRRCRKGQTWNLPRQWFQKKAQLDGDSPQKYSSCV